MKILQSLLLCGALTVGTQAALIEGSLGVMPSISINLNDYDAFAYYGIVGRADYAGAISGDATTDAANLAQFTKLTLTGAGRIDTTKSIPCSFTYSGAASVLNTPAQNNAVDTKVSAFINNSANGSALSLSTVLFAPEQVFQFYILNYNSKASFTATLTSAGLGTVATYSLTQQVLPTGNIPGLNASDATGSGNTVGILTLTVTGAIGDTLTFMDQIDYTGVSNTQYGNTGIAAVTVTAIPEPGAWGLILAGLGALIALRRVRGR